MRYISIFILTSLLGCSTADQPLLHNVTDDLTIVSSSATSTLSVVKSNEGNETVCFKSSPDALSSSSESLGISSKLNQDQESSARSETEMSGRTPTLLLMREAQFNLCNLYLNGVIDKATYAKKFSKQIDSFIELMTTELANTTIDLTQSTGNTQAPSSSLSNMGSLQTKDKTAEKHACPDGQSIDPMTGNCD